MAATYIQDSYNKFAIKSFDYISLNFIVYTTCLLLWFIEPQIRILTTTQKENINISLLININSFALQTFTRLSYYLDYSQWTCTRIHNTQYAYTQCVTRCVFSWTMLICQNIVFSVYLSELFTHTALTQTVFVYSLTLCECCVCK